MVELLLLLWIIHVPIFSCFVYLAVRRDVAITHLHLHLLLQLHHVLLLDNHGDALVR